jgi:hypothetical protein
MGRGFSMCEECLEAQRDENQYSPSVESEEFYKSKRKEDSKSVEIESEIYSALGPQHPEKRRTALDMVMPDLVEAVRGADENDIQKEFEGLVAAGSQTMSIASVMGSSWFQEWRMLLIQAGLIFRGAEPIGDIAPESGAEEFLRSNKFGSLIVDNGQPISVFTDRVIQWPQSRAIDALTNASVFVDGLDQITQRPTLTRMALLSPLPGMALIAGMATQKKTRSDLRECSFVVSSAEWQMQVTIAPASVQEARRVANRVNAIAEGLAQQQLAHTPASGGTDLVAQLEKLKALLDSGAITQQEFDDIKKTMLA